MVCAGCELGDFLAAGDEDELGTCLDVRDLVKSPNGVVFLNSTQSTGSTLFKWEDRIIDSEGASSIDFPLSSQGKYSGMDCHYLYQAGNLLQGLLEKQGVVCRLPRGGIPWSQGYDRSHWHQAPPTLCPDLEQNRCSGPK